MLAAQEKMIAMVAINLHMFESDAQLFIILPALDNTAKLGIIGLVLDMTLKRDYLARAIESSPFGASNVLLTFRCKTRRVFAETP